MVERMLPHNVEVEQWLLGAILLDGAALVEVMDRLKPEHFYRVAHQQIYQAMLRLFAREIAADIVTVGDELERSEELKQVGDREYLSELSVTPTSAHIEDYAEIIIAKWALREGARIGTKLVQNAYAGEEDALATAEQDIFRVIEQRTTGNQVLSHLDAVDTYLDHLIEQHSQRNQGGIPGISTGFPLLDHCIGGWQRSKLYGIAARPSEGKTALALSVTDTAVRAGKNVLFFSMEMEAGELMQRWLAMTAKVDSIKLRDANLTEAEDEYGYSEWDRVMWAHGQIKQHPGKLMIDDTPLNTDLAIRSKARQVKARHGLDLIIVDYIQYMRADTSGGRKFNDRRLEVEECSRQLKAMARELQVPVIALAQINRDAEKSADKRPQLSHLREAGGIEQDLDVACFIWRNPAELTVENQAPTMRVELLILKNRSGKRDTSIPMAFVGPYTQFLPVDTRTEADV